MHVRTHTGTPEACVCACDHPHPLRHLHNLHKTLHNGIRTR